MCDEDYIKVKLGIHPGIYADYKCLIGDGSDNVKGIPGIGPKTAAALMGQFGSLEALLSHPEQIARTKLRDAIEQNADRLRLNQKLIVLDGNASLPFTLDQLTYADCELTTSDILIELGLR
jgi:DNA polymerase-1